ncbi:MAG: hypothetical protein IPH07_38385 [Deltaproteobacteria bacterium]|nr:hypothetical protein [Deltaproteobacteria bacterium]MBK8713696.1 hypothetical protein [Deltaproteobacteria bacterium]
MAAECSDLRVRGERDGAAGCNGPRGAANQRRRPRLDEGRACTANPVGPIGGLQPTGAVPACCGFESMD